MNRSFAALLALCAIAFPLEGNAAILTSTTVWQGSTVTVAYPDKVIFNTGFDLAFTVDSSTMTSPESLAFDATLDLSNTVNLSLATWGYDFSSTWPGASASFSGALNDSSGYVMSAPIPSGYRLTFTDPLNAFGGSYSWLWQQDSDRITWTLHNAIIAGDTNATLILDDWGWLGGPVSHGVLVIDPPASSVFAVSEPSPALLLAGGLLLLAGRLKRGLPRPVCARAAARFTHKNW